MTPRRGRIAAFIAASALFGLTACASTSRYSRDVIALQDELARVESDDRIALRADAELAAAHRAVDGLRLRGARLSEDDFAHELYVAERLIAIAAAEGLARDAERRAQQLSTEREALLMDARTREAYNIEDDFEGD